MSDSNQQARATVDDALQQEDNYGPQHAAATFGATAAEVWGWLQQHERFQPRGKAAVAAMAEPVGENRWRPVLLEVKQGRGGEPEFGTIVLWGACTSDAGEAAAAAADMHLEWYNSEGKLIWSGDHDMIRPAYEWQEAVMFATWAEERGMLAGDAALGIVARKVDFDDSDKMQPHFVLETRDAHGFEEEVARIGFDRLEGFSGPGGFMSADIEAMSEACVDAFKRHEQMRRREGVRLSESVARSVEGAVSAGGIAGHWLAGGAGSAGEVAIELGALAVEDQDGRSWLSEPHRSALCHHPRVVVCDIDGIRSVRIETFASDGSMSHGMDLRSTGTELMWEPTDAADAEAALLATLATGREATEMELTL